MKRVVSMLIAIMLCMVVAGCTSIQNDRTIESEPIGSVDNAAKETVPGAKADAETVSKAYEQYSDVKTKFLTKLTDALTYDTDAAIGLLALLPLVSVEMDLIPVTLLGKGERSIAIGMAFMGARDIEYSGNGSLYSVSYSDKDGAHYLLSITYDVGADALVCTNTKDDKDNIYVQYQKTAFGYVAQYYLITEKGGPRLYQLSLNGEDGIVSISKDVDKPAALTGNEPADFPKTNPAWYAISGKTVTGLTSGGKDLNFEYIPTPTQ